MTAFGEVQDYVERLTRQRIAELPDGTWETEDYIDFDPAEGEGLVPVRVKLTIDGDEIALRPHRLAPGDRDVPELGLRRDVLGRRRAARRRSSPTSR